MNSIFPNNNDLYFQTICKIYSPLNYENQPINIIQFWSTLFFQKGTNRKIL